jgi:hypothetical protein
MSSESSAEPEHLMQDYDAKKAYARWEGSLGKNLKDTKDIFAKRKRFRWLDMDAKRDYLCTSRLVQFLTFNYGRVVWGVFARAFWPIYTCGRNDHCGNVVLSFDPIFEDGPGLFEIAERIRLLRESDRNPRHLRRFTKIIRDDSNFTPTINVPKEITSGRKARFQSIFINRNRLPDKVLNHRLVPVLALRSTNYAMILPLEFWSPELKRRWFLGDPPLNAEVLLLYQAAFPDVEP